MKRKKQKPAKKAVKATAVRKPAAKKAKAKAVKKTTKAKAVKKPAAKKAGKKPVAKAVKKATKKPLKKAVKKAPAKAVKKPAVKAVKNLAVKAKAKAAKKTAKKPVKKPMLTLKEALGKTAVSTKPQTTLLGRFEPPSYRLENQRGKADCLIVCDHASNVVPRALGTLGLTRQQLQQHIAWDPGTADIGRVVSAAIDAPIVYASYSRLVVDLNRGTDNDECMRPVSDHVRIPGNENLSAAARQQRLDEIFVPYHAQIDAQLDRITGRGAVPVLISIHSFTPEMDGIKRPWEIGVLWNKEEKIARQLVDNLRRNNPGMTVGENEPYSLKAANVTKNTVSTHAEARGLPYIILEFRQDLVGTRLGARKWADIFLQSLRPILADPDTYRLRKGQRA